MDVIAPLTSVSDEDTPDLGTDEPSTVQMREVDLLMGCASTLFPLIGQVVDLCRKVRVAEIVEKQG